MRIDYAHNILSSEPNCKKTFWFSQRSEASAVAQFHRTDRLTPMVYAWHGREFMGSKSPVSRIQHRREAG